MDPVLDWISKVAEQAENDLRTFHPDANVVTKRLPDDMEDELAALPTVTPGDYLLKYLWCRQRVEATRPNSGATSAEEASSALLDLTTRAPVPVKMSSGRTAQVWSKSYAAYTRMALLEHELGVLEKAIREISTDVSEASLALAEEAYTLRLRVLNELLGLVLHPDANPPEGVMPPAGFGVEDLTFEDVGRLQLAHLEAGPGRLMRLPQPNKTGDKADEPALSGFGYFMAQWAKRNSTTVEFVARQDIHALVAQLHATAQTPTKQEEDATLSALGIGAL